MADELSDLEQYSPVAEKGREFGRLVCQSLGLNPRFVREVTITASATDLLKVNVTCFSRPSQAPQLMEMLQALSEANPQINITCISPMFDITNMASSGKEMGR